MTDTNTPDNGNGKTPVTKGDILNQDIDKVFPKEAQEPPPAEQPGTSLTLVARRPSFTAEDYDAAKRLAMTGPFIPPYLRGNPGYALGILELAHRYSKYDASTNSWVSFTPTAIASQTYLVEGRGGNTTIGYTSQFIGAILDAFVPWASRMRYRYGYLSPDGEIADKGEKQDRCCTAYAYLRGDPDPFEYTTPALKDITPKNSPLWKDDPDRQLAYYARRAWARLFAPGVLLGVYDVDELEGRPHQDTHRVKDMGPIEGLHERLAAAKEAAGDGPREGFRDPAADQAASAAPTEPGETKKAARGKVAAPQEAKRTTTAPKGKARLSRKSLLAAREAALKARRAAKAAEKARFSGIAEAQRKARAYNKAAEARAEAPPKLPTNPREYAQHVQSWLAELDTEEAIAARWRREMSLRNLCGVIEEERRAIRAVLDQRIADLKK